MVNAPAFNRPNAQKFSGALKLLASTTDKAEGAKKVLSALLRGTEKLLEALGTESGTLKGMGGEPQHHPLGETYFTAVRLRFGAYIALRAGELRASSVRVLPPSVGRRAGKGCVLAIIHNRARRSDYRQSGLARAERNGVPFAESGAVKSGGGCPFKHG